MVPHIRTSTAAKNPSQAWTPGSVRRAPSLVPEAMSVAATSCGRMPVVARLAISGDGEFAKACFGRCGIDDAFVLFGFERAGGVDETAAGRQALGGSEE